MRLFTLRPPPIAFVQFSTFLSSPSFAIVSRSLSLIYKRNEGRETKGNERIRKRS
ncbi:MAG: hypothetical protein ACTS6G_04190 [Candidatus Hodgkinia cicadicola]